MTENNHEGLHVSSPQNIIVENFMVASGSTTAQAIHARAYGLSRGLDAAAANEAIITLYDGLNPSEKTHIARGMGKLHSPNQVAQQSIGHLKTVFPEMRVNDLIREQLPNQDSLESLVVALTKKGITEEQFDNVLRKSWDRGTEQRVKDMKSLAAYLQLYDDDAIKWWQNMDQNQKEAMIQYGQELLEQK